MKMFKDMPNNMPMTGIIGIKKKTVYLAPTDPYAYHLSLDNISNTKAKRKDCFYAKQTKSDNAEEYINKFSNILIEGKILKEPLKHSYKYKEDIFGIDKNYGSHRQLLDHIFGDNSYDMTQFRGFTAFKIDIFTKKARFNVFNKTTKLHLETRSVLNITEEKKLSTIKNKYPNNNDLNNLGNKYSLALNRSNNISFLSEESKNILTNLFTKKKQLIFNQTSSSAHYS